MSKTKVVILSAKSLFIEGIVTRLKQFPQQINLSVLNPLETADYLDKIIQMKPSAIILDAFLNTNQQKDPLPLLLKALPSLRVICLDIHKKYIQVVDSSTCSVERIQELLEILTVNPGGDDLVDFLVGSIDNGVEEVVSNDKE